MDEQNQDPFINLYQPQPGMWNAQLLMWDPMTGDFSPWGTGMGPFSDKNMAIEDGKAWAEAEGCEYRGPEPEESDPRVVENADGSASFAPGTKLVGMGF